jgi:hypothetical protein
LTKNVITRSYSIDDLIAPARFNTESYFLSPLQMLTPFLLSEIAQLHVSVLDSLNQSLSSEVNVNKYSPFFSTLSCQPDNYSTMSQPTQDLIQAICLFEPVPDFKGLRGVFLRSGGIFQSAPSDVEGLIRQTEVINEVREAKELLTTLLSETADMHQYVVKELSERDRIELIQQIDKLNKAKEDLLELFAKDQPKFFDSIKSLSDAGHNFAKAATLLAAENWPEAGVELYNGAKEIAPLLLYKFSPGTPDTSAIEEKIKALQVSLGELNRQVDETMRGLASIQSESLEKLIKLREAAIARQLKAARYFPDVVGVALQDYLQAASGATERLNRNLSAIRASVFSDLGAAADFDGVPLRDECTGSKPVRIEVASGQLGCILVRRSDKAKTILSERPTFREIPLLVVSGGSGAIAASLGLVFRSNEVRVQENLPKSR